MAKEPSASAPNALRTRPFEHDGRPVFVLIPQGSHDARVCHEYLQQLCQGLSDIERPEIRSELHIFSLPPESMIYVCRPIKALVPGKKSPVTQAKLSEPIDLAKEAMSQGGRSKQYRELDEHRLVQLVTKACGNEPNARLFRGQLSGARWDPQEKREDRQSLLLKITDM